MPAYYRAPLGSIVTDTASSIIGALAVANRKARFPLEPEAVEAWELQLPPLVQGCRQLISELPEAARFEILLEYPIPRVGKRIDLNRMIPALSAYIGQVGLGSTYRYLNLTPERFRAQLDRLSPRRGKRHWRDNPALMRFLSEL